MQEIRDEPHVCFSLADLCLQGDGCWKSCATFHVPSMLRSKGLHTKSYPVHSIVAHYDEPAGQVVVTCQREVEDKNKVIKNLVHNNTN